MFFLVALLIIDALVLMGLLRLFTDEALDFAGGMILAFGLSLVVNFLVCVLIVFFGLFGLLLSIILTGVGGGVVVSALYGTEIKRACLIGGVFAVVHLGLYIATCILISKRYVF